MKNKIALLGWTTIEPKHRYQLEAIIRLGYDLDILTNDSFGNSQTVINSVSEQIFYLKLSKTTLTRCWQVFRRLFNERKKIVLCVVAPAGRFSLFYYVICRFLHFPIVAIEWGSVADISRLDSLTRFNMKVFYRKSALVWYKEPWMRLELLKFTKNKTFFLPNAVEEKPVINLDYKQRDITFIWANRLVVTRYPQWFVKGIGEIEKNNKAIKAVMLGFLDRTMCSKDIILAQEKIRMTAPNSLVCYSYRQPDEYFDRSRFFVLAADAIFGNNSLYESMLRGVVPIVSAAPDIELVIQNGRNGIVAEFSEAGIVQAMLEASKMSLDRWRKMSSEARKTAISKLGIKSWEERFKGLLQEVDK